MAKYRVPLHTSASGTVYIETDATDEWEIAEQALVEGVPGICAQCSGWGRSSSLEIGDEWEPALNDATGLPDIYKLEE